jgi:hypothetical protein
MTSFLLAAGAPLVVALVPCLFAGIDPKDHGATLPQRAVPASDDGDRTPWWKPSAMGFDNYS